MKKVKEPKWCNFPIEDYGNLSKPIWGCWALINGKINTQNDCTNCYFFIKEWKEKEKEKKKEKFHTFILNILNTFYNIL